MSDENERERSNEHRPDGGRTWYHDSAGDKIHELIEAVPQASDVGAQMTRTSHLSPQDSVAAAEQRLRTLQAAHDEVDGLAPAPPQSDVGLRGERVRTTLERARAQDELFCAEQGLRLARVRRLAVERRLGVAAKRRRLRGVGERLVVCMLAAADSALAYVGLTLAAPPLRAGATDPLVQFLSGNGAAIAAIAVGCGSAVASMRIAREFARAHRGLFADPGGAEIVGDVGHAQLQGGASS